MLLYAPLNEQAATIEKQFTNLAQSTTSLIKVHVSASEVKIPTQFSNIKMYPIPVYTKLMVDGLNQTKQYEWNVYGLDERLALKQTLAGCEVLNLSSLPAEQYVLVIKEKTLQNNSL